MNGPEQTAWCGVLRGGVQGVGLRPAIARAAQLQELAGFVENSTSGVVVHIEGRADQVAAFLSTLPQALPEGAQLESVAGRQVAPLGATQFEIRPSVNLGAMATRVPLDRRVCESCLTDVLEGDARRREYAFVSCTACGPRYSILNAMPYDRADTTMGRFPLCVDCEREYASPTDRRFHAQTNACRRCGPRLAAAIDAAQRCLRAGRIVALQSLGGFQLCCDATSNEAVKRLRVKKGRPAKPLAVLVADLAMAERLGRLSDDERRWLQSAAGPIVVVRARDDSPLADSVHPGLHEVGLLLPTTPLHALLMRGSPPLVATSGNRDGEPLAYAPQAPELDELADFVLAHDRPIARPIDDSVVRVAAGRRLTLRAARGLAPLPLDLPAPSDRRGRQAGLALGAHQKVAAALDNGVSAVLGPHIGDLKGEAARLRYLEQLSSLQTLYGCQPRWIAHDLHPEYFTTSWVESIEGVRRVAVQHHHAHIAATMAEHGLCEQTVLGFAWDGSGWGPDGTIWGGECLEATTSEFRRVARLRPFRLPGGERAIREPWRVVYSLVHDALGGHDAAIAALGASPRWESLQPLVTRGMASPWTSSMGRLFDAIGALIGFESSSCDSLSFESLTPAEVQYEGQLAMRLESLGGVCAARPAPSRKGSQGYRLPLQSSERGLLEWDWRPLVRDFLEDRRRGRSPAEMALEFHFALADVIGETAARRPALPIVLGGGVFQNGLLIECLTERFAGQETRLFWPSQIPANDGGLAAGQLAIAR